MKKNENLMKIVNGRTKTEKKKVVNNLAIDIADRCQAEINQAYKSHTGDVQIMQRKLTYATDAIIQCYQGCHALCRKKSFVCKGGKTNNWLLKSNFLGESFTLLRGKNTNEILSDCLKFRFSLAALKKTIIIANTQKVEGFNRSIRRSLPKTSTFCKNFTGRAHAAAYAVNNGEGDAISNLCNAVGCIIPKGGIVSKALQKNQELDQMRKANMKKIEFKRRKCQKKRKLFKLYEEASEKAEYEKGKLLKSLQIKDYSDHTYSKKKKVNHNR
ncbi:hypothetical protein FSP39_023143 [Pinctada imbricata]|uniref:Uncharacterized protein n=1 Tax=Pinctada imbricata TaxID=66713 RepID=A0AA88YV71_PINIB|nr:hypothetical protein FSP39_023143 [Pinctada imbricata]